MVRIRLRRVGLKHQPSYRIIAADKEAPRDGRFLEILGFYNPRTQPSTIEIKEDRLFDWMSKGAQPSESVVQILKSVGAMDRFTRYKAGEPIETLLNQKLFTRNSTLRQKHKQKASSQEQELTLAGEFSL